MRVERGERGPVGDHGQEGDTGKTGAKGERGRRGSSLPSWAASAAWVILVVVITTVLTLQGCQINQNSKTTGALCALRADLERRVQASKDFLKENPQGIPGISVAVIRQGIGNQEQTIDALSNLDC